MYNISKDGVLTFNKVEKIKDKQFKDNKEIKEIIFPNTLKEIGEEAFSCCTSLEKVFFPSNLTKIDKSAFEGCSSLKSIHLKSKIRTVDYKAFADCTSLTDVRIEAASNALVVFYPKCFKNTKIENLKLKKFDFYGDTFDKNIRKYLKSISFTAQGWIDYNIFFSSLPKDAIKSPLEEITIYHESLKRTFKDFVFDTDDDTLLTAYPHKKKDKIVVVPEGTSQIEDNSFIGNPFIEKIILPSTIENLNATFVNSCQNLEYIVINSDEAVLPKNLFENCPNIKGIYISEKCAKKNGIDFTEETLYKPMDLDTLIEMHTSFKEINKVFKDIEGINHETI